MFVASIIGELLKCRMITHEIAIINEMPVNGVVCNKLVFYFPVAAIATADITDVRKS